MFMTTEFEQSGEGDAQALATIRVAAMRESLERIGRFDLRFNDPVPLAKVAQAFPHLDLICYHGYYPNVHQLIGVAFRYERIHVVPDMYLFQAGSEAFIQAANGFLGEQLLFGSSYPFRPIGQSIEDLQAMGLKPDVLDKVLHGNAARVLRLA